MKIKIIANSPPNDGVYYSDISKYINEEFEITEDNIFKIDPTGKEAVGVYIKELGIEVYKGEFEIIQ